MSDLRVGFNKTTNKRFQGFESISVGDSICFHDTEEYRMCGNVIPTWVVTKKNQEVDGNISLRMKSKLTVKVRS